MTEKKEPTFADDVDKVAKEISSTLEKGFDGLIGAFKKGRKNVEQFVDEVIETVVTEPKVAPTEEKANRLAIDAAKTVSIFMDEAKKSVHDLSEYKNGTAFNEGNKALLIIEHMKLSADLYVKKFGWLTRR